MHKKYVVALSDSERAHLRGLISAGTAPARKLAHARVLLQADRGQTDEAVAAAVEISQPTVARIRRQFVEQGLEAALNRRAPQREYARKLDGEQEARLIALACGTPPDGQGRWTLRLLAGKLVELEVVADISYQTVRRTLKKTTCSRIGGSSGASRPRPAASSSGGWKTSWMSTPGPTIPGGP